MKKPVKLTFFILLSNFIWLSARSPWRPQDPLEPEIITRWVGDTKTYHLHDHYLELYPIFSKFDKKYFMNHLLPDGPITFRLNPSKSVKGECLKELIEEVLQDLNQEKKEFNHFKVLKKADYNFRLKSGLIILKFNEYPFVLKLLLKTPETFVKQSEGLNPKFFFRMGGGINRHLSNFTRIKNLEEIRKKIDADACWSSRIDTPRKWFWLPENPRWIEVRSKNIGPRTEEVTELPAIYGIIADAIDGECFSLWNPDERKLALEFSHYVGNRVDSHVDNFMRERCTNKIVLVDTEHFPTMIGLKKPLRYKNYFSWYSQLSWKCVCDNFGRHKKLRRDLQRKPVREVCPIIYESDDSIRSS